MKSIATRLETVSTCEAPPSLPLEKFHAKIPPFEKYFATILISTLGRLGEKFGRKGAERNLFVGNGNIRSFNDRSR